MRYDPLTKHEEAKVSLIEGDFYALLSGESERTTFAVDIPEAQARIESGDFWVQSDDAGAKFTNYDDRPVAVATSSEKIVLGRNEGLVLSTDGKAAEKRGVLDAPGLSAPANDGIVYNTSPELAWAHPGGAEGYWLEIGADQAFDTMIVSEFGIPEPAFRAEKLSPGEYYWRVSALDAFGLPGQRSAPWRFTVAMDNVAPFLRIDAPIEGAIERDASLEIQGETEPGAIVTVNGRPAEVTAEGRFVGPTTASEGENRVEIVAADPAGNVTRLVRGFSYMPDRADAITLDASIPRDAAGPDSDRRRCGFPDRQHQAQLAHRYPRRRRRPAGLDGKRCVRPLRPQCRAWRRAGIAVDRRDRPVGLPKRACARGHRRPVKADDRACGGVPAAYRVRNALRQGTGRQGRCQAPRQRPATRC